MTVETRVDPETGDWLLIAPTRATRPDDSRGGGVDAGCPFCPGNEHMTPPERARVTDASGAWRIRVVPNKYPVVSPSDPARAGGLPPNGHGPGETFAATGDHEVLIESPGHDWDLRHASTEEAAAILFALRDRSRALGAERPAVVAFRNYGKAAGASLHHPHSQIVALDDAPPGLVNRWDRARTYHTDTGRRLTDHLAEAERAAGTRVIRDADGLLVMQPRAAGVPHHTMLVPDDGRAVFADAADDALLALARTLPGVLAALAAVLDDPAYNLVVHSGPLGDPDASRWYQWHLGLYPRITTFGGLELGTGVAVNPRAPEQTAPAMRERLTNADAP